MSYGISIFASDRPERTEAERGELARVLSSHLPVVDAPRLFSRADMEALKAAFIKRFDEDLPRNETLMAVAMIGYRMALADMARNEPA